MGVASVPVPNTLAPSKDAAANNSRASLSSLDCDYILSGHMRKLLCFNTRLHAGSALRFSCVCLQLVGLAQIAVCVWLYVYSAGFAPVVGDPVSKECLATVEQY